MGLVTTCPSISGSDHDHYDSAHPVLQMFLACLICDFLAGKKSKPSPTCLFVARQGRIERAWSGWSGRYALCISGGMGDFEINANVFKRARFPSPPARCDLDQGLSFPRRPVMKNSRADAADTLMRRCDIVVQNSENMSDR